MATLPIPGEAHERRPRELSLDLQNVPPGVALELLAEQLRQLAAEKIPNLRDLTVDLVVSPSGTCSLHFRAYR